MSMEMMRLLDKLSSAKSRELLDLASDLPDELRETNLKITSSYLQITIAKCVVSVLANFSVLVKQEIARKHEGGAFGVELDEFVDLVKMMGDLLDWDSVRQNARRNFNTQCECPECQVLRDTAEIGVGVVRMFTDTPTEGNA